MNDLNVIDRFLADFIRYIDHGFGLLGPDIGFLTSTLIAIDITLAGLFWAMGGETDVLGKLLKKILYVGAFAFILNNFSRLADIIFRSFTQAGLTAAGGTMTADQLLQPGRLAGTGFAAAWPLLDQAKDLLGFTSFFSNFMTIMVLLIAWAITIIAFFVLAVQVFITILEFKLTTLAGFILVPFALWNRTSFLAERTLGSVVSSGIKIMVLAVIIGISSGFFTEFAEAVKGTEPDLGQAMSLVLASMTLLGLGIFGPSVASGLVAGAPQLGAGAAIGTAAAVAGGAMLGGGAVAGAARMAGGAGLGAIRAGTSMGSAASTAYKLGQETSGSSSVSAGMSGVVTAAAGAMRQRAGAALGLGRAAERGGNAAWTAGNTGGGSGGSPPASDGQGGAMPGWARDLRAQQTARHHRQAALQTLKEGDRGGASATPDIKERDE
ncbi:P-type conjugative transfer protein TrbL [Sphingomonas kyeonggiensis]|uniref:Type IV secretion system protein TrbL n=1 Tax=Sphingomonas kyeonggiensis TaxID=1268553 RepID=A0A7W6NZD4_9SPHN|nr:P-type conjugative transfer protein TrbL [Sphingomonas kyeonggiensis]MBB4101288.1 type IV secretion system protein TrbL [Sphingomonas kyeonggiensis]